jgi:alkylation response protein AidB-like acyl-CoA dehydrogenase
VLTSSKIASFPVSLSQDIANLAKNRDLKSGISAIEIERLRESHLLSLMVPQKYGGIGATWKEALKVVQEIAASDGSMGQLFGNHLNLTILAHVLGTSAQKKAYYQQTVKTNGFWANAIDTWDTRLRISPEGDNFRLNGVKNFDPIVAAADWRVFSAVQESIEPIFLIIPQNRAGTIANNNFGFEQNQSNISSFTFDNVFVNKNEILSPLKPCDHAFSPILGVITQLTKTYVYLGIAQGALEAAYQSGENPSGADSTKQDPYVLGDYGDLWLELKTAIGLADQVADSLQAWWDQELTFTHEEQTEMAIAVFGAEAFATRVGWDISNRLFENRGTSFKNDDKLRDLQSFGGVSMPWKGAPQNWTINYF